MTATVRAIAMLPCALLLSVAHAATLAVTEPVNVVTMRDCANLVASAKTRQRYVDMPARAIDGRQDTAWRAGDPGPQWIEIDWKAPRTIGRVRLLQPDPPAAARFRMLGKIEGVISSSWEVLAEAEVAPGQAIIDTSFEPRAVRSIRVELTPRAPEDVLAVAELQAFEPPAAHVPDLAWHADWIWLLGDDDTPEAATVGERRFRHAFDLPDAAVVTHARVVVAAHGPATVLANGVAAGTVSASAPSLLDIAEHLRDGRNVVAVHAQAPARGWAGVMAEAAIELAGAAPIAIRTGEDTWRASMRAQDGWAEPEFDDAAWREADVLCPAYQRPPWVTGWHMLDETRFDPPGAPAPATLTRLELPERAAPGTWVRLRATVRCDEALGRNYGFIALVGWDSLTRGDDYLLAEGRAWPQEPTGGWQVGGEYTVEIPVWLPEYAPWGETLDVRIHGSDGQGRLDLAGADGRALAIAPSPLPRPAPPDAAVAVVPNGEGWQIAHGGERLTGRHAAIATMKSFEALYNEVAMGHRLFSIGTYPHYLVDVAENEDANVELCFRIIDRQIRVVRALQPDARFMIAYICRPTPAFLAAHPDQSVLLPDGRRHWTSTASQLFRNASERVVRRLTERLLAQPYAPWIIGYDLQGLSDGSFRWFGHADGRLGPREELSFGVDLTEPALAAWREWLRAKYATNEALRAAWRDPGATIDGAMPPVGAMARDYGGALRDPLQARAAIDYFDFRDELTLGFRQRLADAVRSYQPAGAYVQSYSSVSDYAIFGPVAQLIGTGEQIDLVTPNVANCLGQNHAYAFRRRDEPYVHQVAPATNALHGLLTFSERDNRTFITPLADYKEYSLVGTLARERMEFGADLCLGIVERRLNFEGGRRGPGGILFCGNPEIADEIERLSRIETWAAQEPWIADSDIALFYDSSRSPRYADALTPGPQFNLTYGMLHRVASTLGAPCSVCQIEDMVDPRVAERHRLFVFLNAEVLTDEQCAAIERLKSGGRTLVFMWAPGYVHEQRGPLPERVSAVTGIDLRIDHEPVRARIEIEPGGALAAACAGPDFAELLPYANREHFRNEFEPRFVATDPDAEVLGRYAHGGGPGLVRKRGDGFTTVFCGSCFMPREVLAWIAREAGAHLYCEDARVQVSACRSWLVARNLTGEPLVCGLALKRQGRVVDAFTGERLADGARSFTADLEAWETRIFYLGERDCPGFALRE